MAISKEEVLHVAKLARRVANDLLARKYVIRSHAHTYCWRQAGKQGSSAAHEPEGTPLATADSKRRSAQGILKKI